MSSVPVTTDTAHLPDGIDIFYSDSGAPPNSVNYTTVIILHGSGVNGHNLEKLHDYAHILNLRTVIWNRRDYAGSTKYSEDELNDLTQGRKIFLDRLGIQLAQFLQLFIELHNVPRISTDRKMGGFAIMGWSLGNTTAISLFSDRSLLPPESYAKLEAYVKDLIIYDATLFAFGWKLPADTDLSKIHEPLSSFNANKTPKDVTYSFLAWVSSYYDHPKDPQSINDLHFAERAGQATVDSWNSDQLERFYDHDAFLRSEAPMYQTPMQSAIRELSDRVFGIHAEDASGLAFPSCPVTFLRPTRTTWRCYWFGIQAKRFYDEREQNNKNYRASLFLPIEGGNHFAHWDMPHKMMKTVGLAVRGSL